MMKELATITSQPIVHMSGVVGDMQASAQLWVETMWIGPFFMFPHIQLDELTYHVKPSKLYQSSTVGQRAPSSRAVSTALQ